ncbi:hypothetical protein JXO52_04795 [bacterium]|nr:hypothetical protein [bacterium]
MYSRIVTHDDFDGVISAAICAHALTLEHIFFTGPGMIERAAVSTSEGDVVCDLPCPSVCGMWFDHHAGNLEDLRYRDIDPQQIPGKFAPEKSCARVVYDYFSASAPLPDRFSDMALQADIIDSFDYASIDEWRKETPASIIDAAVKFRDDDRNERFLFLTRLVHELARRSLGDVCREIWVGERYEAFKDEENRMLKQVEADASFDEHDPGHEIVILDRTAHNRQDPIQKNLAYMLYPESLAVLEIKNRFRRGTKSNDLSFSMSLGLGAGETRDVGEIMRSLNIGDGHAGAGAGAIDCTGKDDMLKKKRETIAEIIRLWRTMDHG